MIARDHLPAKDFVGRRGELATFEGAIADARSGLPSVVLVSGDAGIGKTTFVGEGAARSGVALWCGRSSHIGGDTIPLAPLVDLVRQARRKQPTLFDEVPALREWFAPGATPNELPGTPHGGLFAAVLELIAHLGHVAGPEPAAIVGFEDLHWADTVSWDLFEYLARNLIDEHLVLVGTYRANEVATDPDQRARLVELNRLPAVRRIHLDGLDRDDVAAHVASLLGGEAPSELVDRVAARGGGNPFFTSELVAAHLSGETIPAVLSDLISADIADLDEPARMVLSAVSTIGREVTHEPLAAVVGLPEPELEGVLRTVVDKRLLVVDGDAFSFRHPLLGEVVYGDMLPSQRARLHRKVAAMLQQLPADLRLRPDRAGELAFHLDRGGDHVHAFWALLAAADAAETVAPGAAFMHLERAFELWDTVGESIGDTSRIDRLWQWAEISTSTVGNERAVQLARVAFEHGPPRLGAAWGHERLGRYLWSTGRLEESSAEFARAMELLGDDVDTNAAPVCAGLAQADAMAGRDASAEQWCAKVFSLVPSPDHYPAAWTMARRALGIVRSNQGDPAGAVELCRAAVAAAPNAQSRAQSGLYLCVTLGDAGEFDAELSFAQDAVADGFRTGLDRGFGCYFDSLAADALLRLGRWTEIAGVLDRHPVPGTLPVGRLQLARVRATLAALRGDVGEALEHLAVAHELPVDGWHANLREALTADVQLMVGNWDAASQAAERGWATTGTTSVLWAARFARYTVAAEVERVLDLRARREVSDVDAVTTRLQRRLSAARTLAAAVPGGPQRDTAAHLADAAATLTRLTVSDAHAWSDAVACWSDLGDRWHQAAALVREAEAAAAIGALDHAASSLRRSHTIALELGAGPLLADIEAVGARTRISIEPPSRIEIDEPSAARLGLTPREAEVLALVAAGRTNRQIGDELFVSDKTASVHVSNILRKLGVNTRVDAAAVAQRLGIS